MPPKVTPTTATTLKLVGDTSMADIDLQVVIIGQLQVIINQLTSNRQALENKINKDATEGNTHDSNRFGIGR